MSEPDGMMNISEFARLAGLTPKALRLYGDVGLLPPADVDPFSGYRRYAPRQLECARLIATLRLLGMPLGRIEQVVGGPRAAAAREVEAYWRQVEADLATRRSIATVLVDQLRNEADTMTTARATLHPTFGTSHRQGCRARQQDALLATADLVAVADGFGERDDLAAAALATFAADGLRSAIAAIAHEVSVARPAQPDAGTTLTAVALTGSTARITHIGDGRVWLVRAGEVRQLTHDHTAVAALVETGQLTLDEALSHEHRSLLNRALTPGVVADELTTELLAGDRLVLTTDGVHAHIEDLERLLMDAAGPQEVADTVAAAVVAAGEPDNHTIVVADLA